MTPRRQTAAEHVGGYYAPGQVAESAHLTQYLARLLAGPASVPWGIVLVVDDSLDPACVEARARVARGERRVAWPGSGWVEGEGVGRG